MRGITKTTDKQTYVQAKVEGLGRLQLCEFFGYALMAQSVHDGPLHDSVNAVGIPPAQEKTRRHSQQLINNSPPQFLEVLEETHGSHRFSRLVLWRDGSGDFRHREP